MKILYYYWGENSFPDMAETLFQLGHSVSKMSGTLQNCLHDPQAEQLLEAQLSTGKYDLFFSFDYIPFLSDVANAHGIPYICWIFDYPNWTLYADNLSNSCNQIFLFDKNAVAVIKSLGAKHVWHLPLAVNTARLNLKLGLNESATQILPVYQDTLSFVGSLYEKNPYDQLITLPDYLSGYFQGIMAAQKQVWGYSLLPELLAPDIVQQALAYISFDKTPGLSLPFATFLESMLFDKIASDERIEYLNLLSSAADVALYTGSDSARCPNVYNKGMISYTEQMPNVFYHSKINFNITVRSITSGIPVRALDIMGCCGFLLSNYQPELAEYFEPDKDFVYFEDQNDLLEKTRYYLSHDAERAAIASSGWKKVQEHFSYPMQVSKMLQII